MSSASARWRMLPPLILLTAFALLAITSMARLSITGDEVTHLPAGYSYVTTGDFRLNPQHPPLIKALAALPLLALDLEPVDHVIGLEARKRMGIRQAVPHHQPPTARAHRFLGPLADGRRRPRARRRIVRLGASVVGLLARCVRAAALHLLPEFPRSHRAGSHGCRRQLLHRAGAVRAVALRRHRPRCASPPPAARRSAARCSPSIPASSPPRSSRCSSPSPSQRDARPSPCARRALPLPGSPSPPSRCS